MTNGKNKGARYERHVASRFRSEGFDARRGQQYCGANGDHDVVVDGLCVECKKRERLNLYDAIAQAKHDARDGEIPVVIHAKNYCEDLVTMEFDEWIKLWKEYTL